MSSPFTDSSLDSELSRVSHGSSSGCNDKTVSTQGCHAAIRQLSHINKIASGREVSFIAYNLSKNNTVICLKSAGTR